MLADIGIDGMCVTNASVEENIFCGDENSFLVYHDVLGSQAARMEDAGWDESDVKERREYEEYMDCYTGVLDGMLQERGIDPWKDYANSITEDI